MTGHRPGRVPRPRQRLADHASNGKLVGSRLIGQDFSRPVLDKNGKPKKDADGNPVTEPDPAVLPAAALGRPATTRPATFFSNRGPNQSSAALLLHASSSPPYLGARAALRPRPDAPRRSPSTPSTTSASGVDPHISKANAAHPGAPHRRRAPACRSTRVNTLIDDNTDGRFLGLLGEPGVNVIELNLALDKEAPRPVTRSQTALRRCSAPTSCGRRSSDRCVKLDPRVQVRNPVMFVVEIGAVITTITWLIQVVRRRAARRRRRARLVHVHRRRSGCG